ncbi:MAG: GNAT family N-acetyltransferase [Thermomicrobiales bacterium]|nr:GNAT family N-acetyltransferase [Thermomicrobiales bacterium]MCO5223604.1 GNAT family N-acetyltransferase [Thermomicrobiales bacterium]
MSRAGTAIEIEQVTSLTEPDVAALADLLVAVVDQGASVGFLPPLRPDVARAYWLDAVRAEHVVLLVARRERMIVGTVQLEWSPKKNARHRAEVNKLLVHPNAQRLGIGRKLMVRLEMMAVENGWTTLHLDTREGDRSNDFYRAQGWTRAGVIPRWAESAGGTIDGTVFYYKLLQQ